MPIKQELKLLAAKGSVCGLMHGSCYGSLGMGGPQLSGGLQVKGVRKQRCQSAVQKYPLLNEMYGLLILASKWILLNIASGCLFVLYCSWLFDYAWSAVCAASSAMDWHPWAVLCQECVGFVRFWWQGGFVMNCLH